MRTLRSKRAIKLSGLSNMTYDYRHIENGIERRQQRVAETKRPCTDTAVHQLPVHCRRASETDTVVLKLTTMYG